MKSIEARLTSRLLIGVALALGLAGVVVFEVSHALLAHNIDASLATKLGAIAGLTQQEPSGILMEPAEEFLHEYNQTNATAFFQVWINGDHVLKKAESLGATSLPLPPDLGARIRYWTLTLPNGVRARAAGRAFVPQIDDDVPLAQRPKHPGSNIASIVVAMEIHPLMRTMSIIGIVLSCAAALAFAAVVVAVRHSVRSELKPLANLAEFTAGVDATSLGAQFPAGDLPAELVPIATRLNDLLARLAQAFERERQFTSNAAHELRTPLAELRSVAEVALKWPPDRAGADRAFRQIQSVVVRMEAVTNSLLLLARAERGNLTVSQESVVAADAVAEAWNAFLPGAKEQEINATFSLGTTRLRTDPVLFDTVLRNLLGNATAYTPRGGNIAVDARGDEAGGELRIANDSEGLSPSQAAHVGQRFWRKDAAHAASDHAGLGLSVVTTVCAVLDMRVEFRTKARRFEVLMSWGAAPGADRPFSESERESALAGM